VLDCIYVVGQMIPLLVGSSHRVTLRVMLKVRAICSNGSNRLKLRVTLNARAGGSDAVEGEVGSELALVAATRSRVGGTQ